MSKIKVGLKYVDRMGVCNAQDLDKKECCADGDSTLQVRQGRIRQEKPGSLIRKTICEDDGKRNGILMGVVFGFMKVRYQGDVSVNSEFVAFSTRLGYQSFRVSDNKIFCLRSYLDSYLGFILKIAM